MEDLEKELIEMVRIFDSCQIPEEMQREIITEGVYFLFDDNNHASLDCFKFAELLTLCKSLDSDFDANKMLNDIHGYVPTEYEETVKFFIDLEKRKVERETKKEHFNGWNLRNREFYLDDKEMIRERKKYFN
jgi:hypothetical protein